MNINDLIFSLLLMAAIPFLVNRSFSSYRFSPQFKAIVIWGGIFWILYALFLRNFILEDILNLQKADELLHMEASKNLADYMRNSDWDAVWHYLDLSNAGFQVLSGTLLFLTGASDRLIGVIGGFLGFCGGLSLVKYFADSMPSTIRLVPNWFLYIIFPPSIIFWCTAPLKEGWIYWGICQISVTLMPLPSSQRIKGTFNFIVGSIVAVALRPYVAILWIMSALSVRVLFGKRAKTILIMLLIMPITVVAFKAQTGVELDPQKMFEYGNMRAEASLRESEGVAGSNIEYGAGVNQFFLGGLIAMFFRPFPWEIRNLSFLFASLETWSITILIFIAWYRVPARQRLKLIRQPDLLVAGLACVLFCVLLSYASNEGIIARARIQVLPALFTLVVVPLLYVSKNYQPIMRGYSPTLSHKAQI